MKAFEIKSKSIGGKAMQGVALPQSNHKDHSSIISLRYGQTKAVVELCRVNKRHLILTAPTGFGKSNTMVSIIKHFMMIKNQYKTSLIIVPQLAIGNDIEDVQINVSDELIGIVSNDEIKIVNLCNKDNTFSNVRELTTQLRLTHPKKIIILSHSTMVRFFNNADAVLIKKLLRDTAIWIDEAHYSCYKDIELSNQIGKFVDWCINNGDSLNVSCNMVTATYFRGDGLPLIKAEYNDLFARFSYPLSDFMEHDCKYMKEFAFDFFFHDKNWVNSLHFFFDSSNSKNVDVVNGNIKFKKSIIFVPGDNKSSTSIDNVTEAGIRDKKITVHTILRKIANCTDDDIRSGYSADNGTYTIFKDGIKMVVVDLVDRINQEAGWNYLKEKDDSGNYANDVDVVINIDMMKVGTNWLPAKRVLLVGIYQSLTDLTQRVGRALRDHFTKLNDPVQIIQLIQRLGDVSNGDVKDQLNQMMQQMYRVFLQFSIMQSGRSFSKLKDKLPGRSESDFIKIITGAIESSISDVERDNAINNGGSDAVNAITSDRIMKTLQELPELKNISPEEIQELHGGIMNDLSDFSNGIRYDNQDVAMNEDKSYNFPIPDVKVDYDLIHKYGVLGPFYHFSTSCGVGNMRDFLKAIHRSFDFTDYYKARKYVRGLKRYIKDEPTYVKYIRQNPNIGLPLNPEKQWPKLFKGFYNFLGK